MLIRCFRLFHDRIYLYTKAYKNKNRRQGNAAEAIYFIIVELVRVGTFAAGHQREANKYQYYAAYHPHIVAAIEKESLVAYRLRIF